MAEVDHDQLRAQPVSEIFKSHRFQTYGTLRSVACVYSAVCCYGMIYNWTGRYMKAS